MSNCAGLLDDEASATAPSGYAVLRGTHRGRPAALTPIAEALAFRKLPQLFLAAAVSAPDEARPSLEILLRPSGADALTGGATLPVRAAPPAWPREAVLRADDRAQALIARLGEPLAAALHDPKLKAVTVGPRGVRVLRHVAQGARGSYLLFRDSRFEAAAVPLGEARAALDLADALLARLEPGGEAGLRDAA